MKDLNEGEAKENLLAMAKSRGYNVSSDQLNRWHRAGLLPRPRQILLGRRGSKTVYPNGSAEQVIEICRIHEKERRLVYVGWQLWWNGFEVNLKPFATLFSGPLKQVMKTGVNIIGWIARL